MEHPFSVNLSHHNCEDQINKSSHFWIINTVKPFVDCCRIMFCDVVLSLKNLSPIMKVACFVSKFKQLTIISCSYNFSDCDKSSTVSKSIVLSNFRPYQLQLNYDQGFMPVIL